MEAVRTSETSVYLETTRSYTPEDCNLKTEVYNPVCVCVCARARARIFLLFYFSNNVLKTEQGRKN
jgi:hypothetical protein